MHADIAYNTHSLGHESEFKYTIKITQDIGLPWTTVEERMGSAQLLKTISTTKIWRQAKD